MVLYAYGVKLGSLDKAFRHSISKGVTHAYGHGLREVSSSGAYQRMTSVPSTRATEIASRCIGYGNLLCLRNDVKDRTHRKREYANVHPYKSPCMPGSTYPPAMGTGDRIHPNNRAYQYRSQSPSPPSQVGNQNEWPNPTCVWTRPVRTYGGTQASIR